MLQVFVICMAILAVPLFSRTKEETSSDQTWIIDPKRSVGSILQTSSEQDLVKIYGKNNVRREKIGVGEGECVDGTVIFHGTPDAVQIEWKENYRRPDRITIANAGTKWRTRDGITIGTPLEQLQVCNGSAFLLTGFAWDYSGRTVSWKNGKLPPELQLDLDPTKSVSEAEFNTVTGDNNFSSDNAVIKKMALRVQAIHIHW